MHRSTILDVVDRFWEIRVAGDREELRCFLAPQATYEMVGAKAFADKGLVGPTDGALAVENLIDKFKISNVKRIAEIVDGNEASITMQITVSYNGGPTLESEACDIWEFDDAGKVKSLREFVDTALVNRMIEGRV